jgi:hypothetical protein
MFHLFSPVATHGHLTSSANTSYPFVVASGPSSANRFVSSIDSVIPHAANWAKPNYLVWQERKPNTWNPRPPRNPAPLRGFHDPLGRSWVLTVAAADPPDDLVIYGEDVNSLRRGRAAPIAAATAYSGRLPRRLTPSAPRSTYVPSFPASVPPHMGVARRVCAATSEVGESKGQWHQHDKLIIFPQQRTSTCTASPSDGTSAGRPDASRGTAAREIL